MLINHTVLVQITKEKERKERRKKKRAKKHQKHQAKIKSQCSRLCEAPVDLLKWHKSEQRKEAKMHSGRLEIDELEEPRFDLHCTRILFAAPADRNKKKEKKKQKRIIE